MEPACQIRLASRAELSYLPEIERAAASLFPKGRIPDPPAVMPMTELEEAFKGGLLLVASVGDEVVGFAASQERERYLYLAEVSVHPEHGRRGLGTRLVRAVIQEARRRGLSGVTLTTFRDLRWNAPFYAKLGFRILSDSELSPTLRLALLGEARLGMTDRVAMLCSIAE